MFTAWQEIAGIIGGDFAGEIDQLALSISTYVRENKDELVTTIKEVFKGVKEFAGSLPTLKENIGSVIDGLKIFGAAAGATDQGGII